MSSLKDDHLVATAAILYHVRTSETVKLRWGLQVRAVLGVQLARGERPDNYRIDWLIKTRSSIIDVLYEASKEFNAQFTHDRISTLDQLDALESVMSAIKKTAARLTNSSQAEQED
jgi:hypothetical protein